MDDNIGPPHFSDAARTALAGMTLSIQDVLDTIPAGAVVVDPEGLMLAVNREVARQFGYEPNDLLGVRVEILVPAGVSSGHAAMRSKILASDQMRVMGPGRSCGAAPRWLGLPDRSGPAHHPNWRLTIRPRGGV